MIGDASKQAMKELLLEIQPGKFAEEWVKTWEKEGKNAFEKYLKELEEHPIEQVGKKLRKMMWPKE